MNSDTVVFWGTQCFSKREEGNMNTRVCALFFLSRWNPLSFNQATVAIIIHNTFRHCRVRGRAFEGRPFSEQLYILAYIPFTACLANGTANLRGVLKHENPDVSANLAWQCLLPNVTGTLIFKVVRKCKCYLYWNISLKCSIKWLNLMTKHFQIVTYLLQVTILVNIQ